MDQIYQKAPTDQDLIEYVDADDRVLGRMCRREIHIRNLRHRSVHVAVVNHLDQLWLQKRGSAKDASPGCWDLSATGHLEPGESYDEAARRELAEELSIFGSPGVIRKYPATARNGWEFHVLFWLRWDGGEPDYNRTEIEQVGLFDPTGLKDEIMSGNGSRDYTTAVIDELDSLISILKQNQTDRVS